jgi:hypothetical protein
VPHPTRIPRVRHLGQIPGQARALPGQGGVAGSGQILKLLQGRAYQR